jgi:hypothetical protein
MGIQAIVEVFDHAPADLTSAERLILLAIAENIRDGDPKRETWPGFTVALLRKRTGLTDETRKKALQRLARRGLEVRIPIDVGDDGRPVFAVPGKQTRYRLPALKPGGNEVHPPEERVEAFPPSEAEGWNDFPPKGGTGSRQAGTDSPPTPHPSKNPPQESAPSSLSPSAASTPSADPPPVVERETKSHSKTTINSGHKLVKDTGLLGDHEVSDFVAWMKHRYEKPGKPLGPHWWRTLIDNEDLPEHIVQWYASQQPRAWDDYEETVPTYTEYTPAEFNPPRPTSGPMATFDHYDEDDIWK